MLQKYKYAGFVGTKVTTICDVWTGIKGVSFGRTLLPAGAKYLVTGFSIDVDGLYRVSVRQVGGLSHTIRSDSFDRNFISI